MERKCSTYQSVNEIRKDLKRIVTNSVLFNGELAPITLRAKELEKQGLKELRRCEEAETGLRLLLEQSSSSSSLSQSLGEGEGSTVNTDKAATSTFFLLIGILFHSSRFYSFLLQDIWNCLLDLVREGSMPVSDNKMAKHLFYLYNLVRMTERAGDILDTLPYSQKQQQLKQSSQFQLMFDEKRLKENEDRKGRRNETVITDARDGWTPEWLLSKQITEFSMDYNEFLIQLVNTYVMAVKMEYDKEVVRDVLRECHKNCINTHLVLSSIQSLCHHIFDLGENEDIENEIAMLRMMCEIVLELPVEWIEKGWDWMESAGLTVMCGHVGMNDKE